MEIAHYVEGAGWWDNSDAEYAIDGVTHWCEGRVHPTPPAVEEPDGD
jgi:hypothetical protein